MTAEKISQPLFPIQFLGVEEVLSFKSKIYVKVCPQNNIFRSLSENIFNHYKIKNIKGGSRCFIFGRVELTKTRKIFKWKHFFIQYED